MITVVLRGKERVEHLSTVAIGENVGAVEWIAQEVTPLAGFFHRKKSVSLDVGYNFLRWHLGHAIGMQHYPDTLYRTYCKSSN